MDEQIRNDIIHRWHRGQSQREIAKRLHVSRNTIKALLDELQCAREGRPLQPSVRSLRKKRTSVLDKYESNIKDLLVRYPEMRIVELLRHLRKCGYSGSYTILRQRVRALRVSTNSQDPANLTAPGAVAKVECRKIDIKLAEQSGRQTPHLFLYRLLYSRRLYVRFCPAADLATLIHQHVCAFEYLGGAAAWARYDENTELIDQASSKSDGFNRTFMRFATHYGFRPVESPSALRGPVLDDAAFREELLAEFLRDGHFRSIDHANDALLTWVKRVVDPVPYRGSTPVELHREEVPHLIPLPTNSWPG